MALNAIQAIKAIKLERGEYIADGSFATMPHATQNSMLITNSS